MKLRYDGPLVLDRPSTEVWTVTERTSPYYRFTNSKESLLTMGFSEAELNEAKGVK